ncbi:DUF3793 family protein [Desulfosporosinus youngiae]|uniref:DUF3793 domain-containing protein n=1 Tax=Desulfosporosinus youngiae DSM 17734 TaxID=768710 RepID=H5Y304_9FIRM|nr:DUF3793 family protein [Desulfosporosinus youngiae]EHQ88561.1 hypothetical protein DesyoDRAFT_1404 [Desulfosporosinus youngiae DSM 17734]
MPEQMDHLDTKHLTELIDWAKNKTNQHKHLFLVESLAPLVLRFKPSVLLNVSLENETAWKEFKGLFTQPKALQIKTIRKLNGRLQVIFYQKELLDSVLRQKPIQEFLKTLSYPKQYSLNAYLSFLKHRITSLAFPHEVGVFLGYPLKDVLGFMGLLPLPYKRTQGWRIYGEETPSNEIYEKYRQARSMMRKLAGDID